MELWASLRNLQAFRRDGELALSNAFQTVFKDAKHWRCFLHCKSNLDDKLKKLHVLKSVRTEFFRDIFGNPADLEEGLVDAEDEEYYEASLCSLHEIWNDRENLMILPSSMNGLSTTVKAL